MEPNRSYAQPSPEAKEFDNVEDRSNASEADTKKRRAKAMADHEVQVNDEDRKPLITSRDEVEDG